MEGSLPFFLFNFLFFLVEDPCFPSFKVFPTWAELRKPVTVLLMQNRCKLYIVQGVSYETLQSILDFMYRILCTGCKLWNPVKYPGFHVPYSMYRVLTMKPCKVSWISCTVFYVQGVNYETLQSILDFMYQGEVMVCRENLNSFLRLAKELEVKKLTLCHKLVF